MKSPVRVYVFILTDQGKYIANPIKDKKNIFIHTYLLAPHLLSIANEHAEPGTDFAVGTQQ